VVNATAPVNVVAAIVTVELLVIDLAVVVAIGIVIITSRSIVTTTAATITAAVVTAARRQTHTSGTPMSSPAVQECQRLPVSGAAHNNEKANKNTHNQIIVKISDTMALGRLL